MDRTDAFEMALVAIRERLREGAFRPGSRIPAVKVAADLALSATPVREALSRLAGEGLVEERRQQGFFVRTLTGVDVADLYRMNLAHLSIAHGRRAGLQVRSTSAASAGDSVRDVEALFLDWIESAGSASLLGLYRPLSIQLGPVRRVEQRIIPDLDLEARDLLASGEAEDPAQRIAMLRRFHTRRVALADQLASLVNRPEQRPKI